MTTRRPLFASVPAALMTLLLAGTADAGAPPQADPPAPQDPAAGVAPPPRTPAGREVRKPETHAEALKRLYDALAQAPDAAAAEPIVREIEQIWIRSDSPTASLLLSRALAAAEAKDFDLALQFLDHVTELYPDWPEGFNRRAYVYVVKLEYSRALGDLRRVLALDPGNFRALEGLVQILRTMGQDKAALDVVRTLLKAHPNSPGARETLKELEDTVDGRGI